MTEVKSICVYCGSRTGNDPRFSALAESFGALLARNGIRLVYGGGSVGLMGMAARSVLAHGGEVIGVIPEHLDHVEITQSGLSELHVVPNMHSRKHLMFELSDAFVSLPGSIGTLDETIEVITWKQLGLHDKPILLVNAERYWDPFDALIRHVVAAGFASNETRTLYTMVAGIEDVLPTLGRAPAPMLPDRDELI
ncbi:MAG: TIGR00730 family Rossman fold protein [Alphaproteobacteria bacterium]|nr:MAG: TIGR00730 family Rossman fold protein [Alphaproteobacteria bacterium]